MKNVILTSASLNMSSYLIEFCISLREIAKFQGDVIVLGYGLDDVPGLLELLNKLSIYVLNCEFRNGNPRSVAITRFFDMTFLINYDYDNILHLDCDMWFQSNIDDIFNIIDSSNGCIYVCEKNKTGLFFRGPDHLLHEFQNKIKNMVNKYGGHINIGFMGGKKDIFLNKLNCFINSYSSLEWLTVWGTDQSLAVYYFNDDDIIIDNIWNLTYDIATFKENKFYYNNEEGKIIHDFSPSRNNSVRMSRYYDIQQICDIKNYIEFDRLCIKRVYINE